MTPPAGVAPPPSSPEHALVDSDMSASSSLRPMLDAAANVAAILRATAHSLVTVFMAWESRGHQGGALGGGMSSNSSRRPPVAGAPSVQPFSGPPNNPPPMPSPTQRDDEDERIMVDELSVLVDAAVAVLPTLFDAAADARRSLETLNATSSASSMMSARRSLHLIAQALSAACEAITVFLCMVAATSSGANSGARDNRSPSSYNYSASVGLGESALLSETTKRAAKDAIQSVLKDSRASAQSGQHASGTTGAATTFAGVSGVGAAYGGGGVTSASSQPADSNNLHGKWSSQRSATLILENLNRLLQ